MVICDWMSPSFHRPGATHQACEVGTAYWSWDQCAMSLLPAKQLVIFWGVVVFGWGGWWASRNCRHDFLELFVWGKKSGGGGFGVFFEKILECDSTVLFRLKVRCFSEKASYWIMVCWEHVDFRFSYGAQLEETARWISRFETRAPI